MRANGRAGSMLLESLLAVVMMAVTATVLMGTLMNNAKAVDTVQHYARLWLIASQKLEEKHFWDKSSVVIPQQQIKGPGGTYDVAMEIKPLQQEPWQGLTQLEITTAQTGNGEGRRVRLRTVLVDDGTTQTKQSIFYR